MTDLARIQHDGSACPVSPGTRVRVWWAHGTVGNAIASQVNWSAHPHYAVTHYAVLEPDWAVEGPKLAEALKPFADAAKMFSWPVYGHDKEEALGSGILVGDLRRARAALSRIKGEEG